ncbi:MAG TPA: cytochrome o ubiquinol oxidase subunit IV [Gammaproteobacteria bacterium]|nr:cytochrome o ubiquinol oxidase subunit IV [Gammaproteobacteria bacterium]
MSEQRSMESTGLGHASARTYLTGFILAVILTLIPFALVMDNWLSWTATVVAIFTLAVIQILVHLHYFLHLDTSSSQRWNVMAIVFTGIIVLILVGGSVWIMFSLRYRTQPAATHTAPAVRRLA